MGVADWDLVTTGPTFTPGPGTLRVDWSSAWPVTGEEPVAYALDTRRPHGLLRGQMEVDLTVINAPTYQGLGVLCSQADMRTGFGGKGFALGISTLVFHNKFMLAQLNDGFDHMPYYTNGTTADILAESAPGAAVIGAPARLSLLWEVDTTPGQEAVHLRMAGGTPSGAMTTYGDIRLYGPGAYVPLASAGEAVFFAGSTNVTACVFGTVRVWQG